MAFDMSVITQNVPAVIAKLAEKGINALIWNPGACASSGEVEAHLGFESQQDLQAAQEILQLVPA